LVVEASPTIATALFHFCWACRDQILWTVHTCGRWASDTTISAALVGAHGKVRLYPSIHTHTHTYFT